MQKSLSKSEIYQLSLDPFGKDSPLNFRKELSTEHLRHSPMFRLFHLIFKEIETVGALPLTQKGNFQRAFCNKWYEERIFKDSFIEVHKNEKINQQDDWIHLKIAHAVLNLSSLVKKRLNKFSLTKKGKQLLNDPPELFKELLDIFCTQYNWGYTDLYPEGIAQQGFAYGLYLLQKHGSKRRKPAFYAEEIMEAFPFLIDGLEEEFSWNSPEETFKRGFETRFFARFTEYWGFSHSSNDRKPLEPLSWVKKATLIDQVFEFKKLPESKLQDMLPINPMATTRAMDQITQILQSQDLGSVEDLNEFLAENIVGKNPEELKELFPSPDTPQQKALDLVFQAYGKKDLKKQQKLVAQAIQTDPDCTQAYIFKGDNSNSPEEAIPWYKKAIEVAEKQFDKKFIEENKGHFWLITETRPYMQAKCELAVIMKSTGKVAKAIDLYQELLELNPNDNQGNRYELLPLLIHQNRIEEATQLLSAFDDEVSASWLYNHAFLTYIKEGPSKSAGKLLQKAFDNNPFVPEVLLEENSFSEELPNYYSPGDKSEALVYVSTIVTLMTEKKHFDMFSWMVKEHAKSSNTSTVSGKRVSRNALCPCGSGKKYKRCCGRN